MLRLQHTAQQSCIATSRQGGLQAGLVGSSEHGDYLPERNRSICYNSRCRWAPTPMTTSGMMMMTIQRQHVPYYFTAVVLQYINPTRHAQTTIRYYCTAALPGTGSNMIPVLSYPTTNATTRCIIYVRRTTARPVQRLLYIPFR